MSLRLNYLLSALVGPAQDLENALWDLFTKTSVYTAFGMTLDQLGTIVGEKRAGDVDDVYFRRILAKIATNKSKGLVPDLITVVRLILNDETSLIRVEQLFPASIRVTISVIPVTIPVTDVLIKFLRLAKAAGVRLTLITSNGVEGEMFAFDGSSSDLGFDDFDTPGSGGKLANAVT